MNKLLSFTVNTLGDNRQISKDFNYNAYYADNVTAIEVKARNKVHAKQLVRKLGIKVLYAFE